jgi:hypothetical protein
MCFEKFVLCLEKVYLKPICSLLEKSFTVFGPVKTRVIAWKRQKMHYYSAHRELKELLT